MKRSIRTYLYLLSIFLFSCNNITHQYYFPNSNQVPLFKEKKEIRASASVGGSGEAGIAEIQAAYSVGKNIGIMSNAIIAGRGNPVSGGGLFRYKNYEGAAGYFKDFKKFGVFEVYGGFGAGQQNHNYKEYIDSILVSFLTVPQYEDRGSSELMQFKCFIQPSYGISLNAFDAAVSSRISNLYFINVKNNITSDKFDADVIYLKQNRNLILFEPGITVRAGWKYIKMQLNYTYSMVLTNANPRFSSQTFSAGFYLAIAKRYKKDKTAKAAL